MQNSQTSFELIQKKHLVLDIYDLNKLKEIHHELKENTNKLVLKKSRNLKEELTPYSEQII